MGANSFRKRVFQGPLTLGLHSTTFRSALPSATLPYPRRFHYRANRALAFLAFFCFCRLLPTFVFRGCSHRFSPVRIPTPIPSPRKPRTSFFSLSSFPSVRTDVRFTRVLSQVFTCSGTRSNSFTALNRALVLFAFFCSRRLQPTFALRGCSLRFSPVRIPMPIPSPHKPPTSQCKL